MRRSLPLILAVVSAVAPAAAGGDSFEEFVKATRNEFEQFRSDILSEYTSFVADPWQEFNETAPVPEPQPAPVPPIDYEPAPVEPRPVVIDEVIRPIVPAPQPRPVEPIEPVRVPVTSKLNFTFYGTPASVRLNTSALPMLRGSSERDVASFFDELSGMQASDALLQDCIELRNSHKLSDWAYLNMLDCLGRAAYPSNGNAAEMLTAFIFVRSGYQMRPALDRSGQLFLLYGTKHLIYNRNSFVVDGVSYYSLRDLPSQLQICRATFPGERPLSLTVDTDQVFAMDPTETRTITSRRYPQMSYDVTVNRNRLTFYESYPSSCINNRMMTRWAMYARTPMDHTISDTLYPAIRTAVQDKSSAEAVQMILNFVQTAFVYGYDDQIWGHDRAFFPEETLYYPKSDCEDRAILFTRLVRDITGLDCVLVYYPGHLAAAVDLGNYDGDWLEVDGRRFTIADPTYVNAPVGETMPNMDNSSAVAIIL